MSNSNQPKKEIESIEILPENYPSYNISFKVIVIGDTGVGKSCISLRATKSVFNEQYMATVGFEYCTFIARLNGEVLKLQIWDTCGQEMYRSLVSNFYKSSALAIVVYAINDRKSFEDIDEWIDGVRKNSSSDIILFLVGNKFDVDEDRERILLAHKNEIRKLSQQITLQGITLIPLKIYFSDKGKIKVLMGICKGKKNFNKRETLKLRQIKRDIERSAKYCIYY